MQNMIKKIVEIDEHARKITDEAEKEKLSTVKEIANKREEIREEYLSRARDRIEKNKIKFQKEAENIIEKAKEENQKQIESLEDICKKNQDIWVKDIINKVIRE